MTATLTSKGQLTIPVAVRRKMRLETGTTVCFVFVGDSDSRAEMFPVQNLVNTLKGLVAKPKKPVSLAQMRAAIDRGGEK